MNTRARVERILSNCFQDATYDMGRHLDLLMSESYRGRHGNNSLFHNAYVTRMQTTNNLTQDYFAQEYCEVL